MPSGITANIPTIMTAISNRHGAHSPITSVLDIGIGWGKYGLLCREYMSPYDVVIESSDNWKFRLDGVEVFKNYIKDYIHCLYKNVWNLDVREFCTDHEKHIGSLTWDLIMMVDVIEHIPKEDGHIVLQTLLKYSHWILISVPTKLTQFQNVKYFHAQELHVCAWTLGDFKDYKIDEVIQDNETLILILRGDLYKPRPPKR